MAEADVILSAFVVIGYLALWEVVETKLNPWLTNRAEQTKLFRLIEAKPKSEQWKELELWSKFEEARSRHEHMEKEAAQRADIKSSAEASREVRAKIQQWIQEISGGEPMPFSKLRALRERVEKEMSRTDLPKQTLDFMQDFKERLTSKLRAAATEAGVKGQFEDAERGWREYLKDFEQPGNPLHTMLAGEADLESRTKAATSARYIYLSKKHGFFSKDEAEKLAQLKLQPILGVPVELLMDGFSEFELKTLKVFEKNGKLRMVTKLELAFLWLGIMQVFLMQVPWAFLFPLAKRFFVFLGDRSWYRNWLLASENQQTER